MIGKPFIMLTRQALDHIASSADATQPLHMKRLDSEDLYLVDRFDIGGARIPMSIPDEYATLKWQGTQTASGQWFRKPSEEINYLHAMLFNRPHMSITFEDFRARVPGVQDPGKQIGFVITYDPDVNEDAEGTGIQKFAGWLVSRTEVIPVALAAEPETLGLEQLAGQWPIDRLAVNTVMVVGVGSIGGVMAESLAAMGVGSSILVDPDRFLWHNSVRHILGNESVGRYKVDAMRNRLRKDWPTHNSVALRYDVVEQAHLIRPLLKNVDLVICAADGIAPRRVVSHLARRAHIPAVLACVLVNGGLGEVLRFRPAPNFGCLFCHRAELATRGAIDPEADQELAYGTGHVHKPMTAIPTDLVTVGALAAKVAVATLLESRHGDPQRLPGEQAVIGLRANLHLTEPYNVTRVGEVTWHDIPPPRPTCPTCNPA